MTTTELKVAPRVRVIVEKIIEAYHTQQKGEKPDEETALALVTDTIDLSVDMVGLFERAVIALEKIAENGPQILRMQIGSSGHGEGPQFSGAPAARAHERRGGGGAGHRAEPSGGGDVSEGHAGGEGGQ